MIKKKMLEVVAALIWQGNRFMACKRPPDKARGLLWEFVGGKVEPGETKQQALVRECKEELDIEVCAGSPVMEVTHEYPDVVVHLSLFESYILKGEPKLLEHCDLQWITVEQVDSFQFCPADQVILDWLKKTKAENLSLQEREIRAGLFSMQDLEYKKFLGGLIPSVEESRIIGVRMPDLKRMAQNLESEINAEQFLKRLPHRYYEETTLHGLMIAREKSFDKLIQELNEFLPFIDNWATCDSIRPGVLKKHPQRLMQFITVWLNSGHEYTVRFGLEMLMTYYLDDEFKEEYLDLAAQVTQNDYYVKMMQAWLFATALAKQWDAALPYLQNGQLNSWVHNKTIQKAIESRRISQDKKIYLKTLKIKSKEEEG